MRTVRTRRDRQTKNGPPRNPCTTSARARPGIFLTDIVCTARDGRVSKMEHVYIRGSRIKFLILPDLLKHSPVFDKVKAMKQADEAKPRRR